MTPAAEPARPRAAGRPSAPARGRAGVLGEIAARRAADVAAELGSATYRDLARAAAAAPAPRDALLRLARPGLHLIAEVKRSSPSAGAIAAASLDPVAQARAYAAGGASVISVLCEPHWFEGSVEDLRAVRAAVAVPVLAKEFVVDPRQLPVLRAAGADLVLLMAALHPARRLADLVARARDLGLEPLVEVHAERELEAAVASGARIVGINARDLQTLVVDPDHPIRLRGRIPDDRITVAESGARDPATIARWRAAGYDAALVGEALVRAADPRAAAAAFVAAGAMPDDPGAAHRIPFVKICGVVDDAGLDAALAAGADAIGLNFVAGTPRALSIAEGAALARRARAAGGTRTPLIVAITAGAADVLVAALAGEVNVDAIQYAGGEPPDRIAASPRPAWAVVHLPAQAPADASEREALVAEATARARAHLAAGAARIVLDTAGGPHPGGTGTRADATLAAAVAREVPVILAGGLNPASVADALLAVPAVGVDVASGVEAPRVAGRAAPQGPAGRRAPRQARARRALRPPERPLGPDPGPRRPHRGRRPRPLGCRARLRRALRPRDADRRPGAARGRLDGPAPRPGLLGRAARAAGAVRRSPHRALPGGSPGCRRPGGGGPPARGRGCRRRSGSAGRRRFPPRAPDPAGPRLSRPTSASTSSARILPTPGPTRSTTPSVRRCLRVALARPG